MFIVCLCLMFTGCRTVRYVPVKEVEYVHVRDSVYFRDTLVRIELEKARLSDFVDVGDTLVLSDAYSRSTAFLDTTSGKLRGTLETVRDYVEKNVPVKEKTVYRDSLVYKDRPVPVEVEKVKKVVPFFWKFFAVIGIAALCWVLLKYVVFRIRIDC